jgi:hypothetical protein
VKTPARQGMVGRERAIYRIWKLEAVTVGRGAAPAEAEFAARRARLLATQFSLDDDGSAAVRIDLGAPAPRVKAGLVDAPRNENAAAAAYRTQPHDRRRSAFRCVELA